MADSKQSKGRALLNALILLLLQLVVLAIGVAIARVAYVGIVGLSDSPFTLFVIAAYPLLGFAAGFPLWVLLFFVAGWMYFGRQRMERALFWSTLPLTLVVIPVLAILMIGSLVE
ncbi:MAG: hypothetical protein R3272_02385 [Candidatus Promineifilaceae bacterium]|nr:hypothetical protein [Candidatus Promineifilaceae bacterium]